MLGLRPTAVSSRGDDPPVGDRHPLAQRAVVPGRGHPVAHGEADEVLHVDAHGLGEAHLLRAGRHRLVGAQVDGIGVDGRRRQLGGHGVGAERADGEFRGAHVEHVDGCLGAVVEDHHRVGAGVEEHRGLPRAVGIGDLAPAGDLDVLGREQALQGGGRFEDRGLLIFNLIYRNIFIVIFL